MGSSFQSYFSFGTRILIRLVFRSPLVRVNAKRGDGYRFLRGKPPTQRGVLSSVKTCILFVTIHKHFLVGANASLSAVPRMKSGTPRHCQLLTVSITQPRLRLS